MHQLIWDQATATKKEKKRLINPCKFNLGQRHKDSSKQEQLGICTQNYEPRLGPENASKFKVDERTKYKM